MARDLGAEFASRALESAGRAGRLLAAGNVEEGLAQLTREELIGGVRQGVETVAKAAGVAPLDVFKRLPMADLEAQVEGLERHRCRAFERWQAAAPAAAESASPSADSTIPGALLVRLADGTQDDPQLRAALISLANDLNAWRESLDRCQTIIAEADDLARRCRRRRLVRLLAVSLIPLALIGTGAWLLQRHLVRQRIDAVLAGESCAVAKLAEADRARASAAQQQAISKAEASCAAKRERARRAEEARKKAEAKRLAAEKARKERLERCDQLKRAFESGTLDAAAKQTAGQHAGLLERLAQERTEPADVTASLEGLPCLDTKLADAVGAAFARQLAATASTWLRTETPSKAVRDLVIEHRAAVETDALLNLGAHIDKAASRAVMTGKPEHVERFRVLCELTRSLELPKLGNCIAVLDLAAQK